MHKKTVYFLVFLLIFAFSSIADCQKQSVRVASYVFVEISKKIDGAAYEDAYNAAYAIKPKNLQEQCEKDILLGRIFFAQGAFYLAENRLNAALAHKKSCRSEIIEKAYLLRGDVYYQMLELDRNYENTLELGRYWQQYFPKDELRKSIYHTLKAQYFAALIKGDSTKFHTQEALRLYRKQKVKESELPLWSIYSNHVACLRNGFSAPIDLGFDKQIAYSDTCFALLNAWFPRDNMEKLRTIQSLSIVYFDRVAAYENWLNLREQTALSFSKYSAVANQLSAFYTQKAGPRHPYNPQVNYLLGLANHYKRDTLAEFLKYKQSIENMFSAPGQELPFCLNWRRYFALLRYYPFVSSKFYFKNNRYKQLQLERKWLENSEELFYLRYFYNALLLDKPEDDAYLANPFFDLEDINLDLYQITSKPYYLKSAWAAGRKGKYTDLLRQRYRELNRTPTKHFLEKCRFNLGTMRLMNDSILLCSHRFADFKFKKVGQLSTRLRNAYAQFKNEIQKEQFNDPLAGKFLNGQEAFTIPAVQKVLKGKNAAWLEISHGGRAGNNSLMIWYIASDTVWVKQIKDADPILLALNQIENSVLNLNEDSWRAASYSFYTNFFKNDFDLLRQMKINRIFYSSGQNLPTFSPEMLVTNSDRIGRPHFLIEEFAFSTQLGAPTAFHDSYQTSSKITSKACDVFVPKLGGNLLDLAFARNAAKFLGEKYSMNLFDKKCESREFLKRLENAHTIQVFSHGEGEKGIWFSDRLIAPSEIRTMKIPAELVSLTTCDSYTGELVRNEGMRGMVEAFSRAGTKRILASLWKIDERASAEIITQFYSELFREMDPDMALQQAQIQFLNTAHPEEQHPYYWSGIQLFGNPTAYRVAGNQGLSFLYSTIVGTIGIFALLILLIHKLGFKRKN